MASVQVRRLEGKRIECRAGRHVLITDRKPEDGGADAGCTSGELLLAAVGSCAAGSTRTHLEARGLSSAGLALETSFQPSVRGGRDRIVIELSLPGLAEDEREAVRRAASSGGVVSRLALGSEIEVRLKPDAPA